MGSVGRRRVDALKITLTPFELDMACNVGLRRHLSAITANRKPQHGIDPDDCWRAHIEGACGELAVAKFLNRYWDGSVDTFRRQADFPGAEIRTRSKHTYDLIVREDDDPNKTFVLVTGVAPNYWIRGWIRGHDARRDEWRQTYGGRPEAWFVPAKFLKSFKEGA